MKREQCLKILFVLCLCSVIGRLLFLHFSERQFLREVAENLYERNAKETILRGVITDREGAVIALSTPIYDVWVNPRHFNPAHPNWPEVARLLGLNAEQELIALQAKQKSYFVFLKRQVAPTTWQQVKALKVPGINADMMQKRFYPDAEVLAHVLGFVNIDGVGQEGLELAYDSWLAGRSGTGVVQKDLLGNWVGPPLKTIDAQQGKPIALSLDRRIQFLVHQALKQAVIDNVAESGSAVVLDIETGEVLAMANWPSFNPNDRETLDPGESRNRAVTDIFEPGSVIKPFAALAAMKEGKFKLSDEIDTSPGYVRVGKNIVRDHENYGKLTLEQVLQKSSNVGISYVVTRIDPEGLPTLLRDLEFGRSLHLHFPGEAEGVFPSKKLFSPFELSTMSFGYGFSVSVMQLARAYAVIGSGGLLREVTLLRVKEPMPAHRVLNEETANLMLYALTSVVKKGGTATKGNLENYRVSGKTGTSLKAVQGGYASNAYRSAFVGIAPLRHPRLVMAVMIDDPKSGEYYGGAVAAPVFKDAMEQILPLLGVPPDREDDKR